MANFKANEKLTKQILALEVEETLPVPTSKFRISVVRTTASHLNSSTEFTFTVTEDGKSSIVKRVK